MRKLSLAIVLALLLSLMTFGLAETGLDGVYKITEYVVNGQDDVQAVLDLVLKDGEMYITIGGGSITLSMNFMGQTQENELGTFEVKDDTYCAIGGELALYSLQGDKLTIVDSSGRMVMERVGGKVDSEQGLIGTWKATAVKAEGNEEAQSAFDLIIAYGSITLDIDETNLVMTVQVLGSEEVEEYTYSEFGTYLYINSGLDYIFWEYDITDGVLTITTEDMVMTLERV